MWKILVGDKFKDKMTGKIVKVIEIKGSWFFFQEISDGYQNEYWINEKWLKSSRYTLWTKAGHLQNNIKKQEAA